ncbi:hybrid sensor histidine kinase/response regulator [Paraburkholderia hospita]|uniref:hybrid sensor histidine kinase/response regulator n=1 Tax=Paraburkholderia hospita TaxID=169430 RepID=UPI000271BF68|nr:ATP-binding protein [Paraburkholderia hospita]SKC77257.1 Signal transduction histidine kinase [Paraburkholderia hospita]
MEAIHPANERERLKRLHTFGILDTPAESALDAITRLAAMSLRAPIALINFIDETRQWCKSAWGMQPRPVSRRESLCAHALVEGDMLVIPNATEDERFRDHPQVVGEPKVVFYAGAVLKTSDGAGLGTLCAIDHEPHKVTDDETSALRTLANRVVIYLEGRQASKQLSEAQSRLETASRNRDEFLAMLAHELRAPLAPIHAAVEVLARPAATEAQRIRAQQILRRHVHYMSQIVDDLLSASLVSRGAVALTLEPVQLRDLVDRAVELSEAAMEKGVHSLTIDVDGALYVDADTTQCPLIIAHLLKNAATYTPSGGRIDVSGEASETEVALRVHDTGSGIAAADLEDIFELFRQTERSLARSPGGMGLGLTLARKLAELHGGTLVARSEGLGRGSEFILTLRRAAPATAPVIRESEDALTATPMSVLVIDDNHDTADAIALYFELSGHETRVAYRAAEALAIVDNWVPDVVLSDIGLPDMDGYELVRAFRKLERLQATTFVAITGYADDRTAALEAGFDAHMPKPADAGKLERFLIRHRAKSRRSP